MLGLATCHCGKPIKSGEKACKTLAGITCLTCAKTGGVDVGAFAQPVENLVSN